MGFMVVQQRHLWLTLADLKDADSKVLLNAPISPSGLFGDAVESIIERFAEAQKRAKATSHVMPRRSFQPPSRSRSSSATRPPQRREERPAATSAAATSLSHSTLEGDALTSRWPAARLYAFPPIKILPLVLCKIREERASVILIAPNWPNQPWLPDLTELREAPHWPIPVRKDMLSQVDGSVWHPNSELWSLHVWPLQGHQRRWAPYSLACSTRSRKREHPLRLYALKWGVFVKWCSQAHIDPATCTVSDVLGFLQYRLDSGLLPSTLKVYVAAITAFRSPQSGQSFGKTALVVSFLKGARRLHPPRPPSVPPWDLEVVLRALSQPPFEPLTSVGLKELSLKTTLLLALASSKRIGDVHAFSVDSNCIRFGPGDCSVTLRPRLGYVPKSLSTPFRTQTVSLSALSTESSPSRSANAQTAVCPVRALRIYIDRSASFRQFLRDVSFPLSGNRGYDSNRRRFLKLTGRVSYDGSQRRLWERDIIRGRKLYCASNYCSGEMMHGFIQLLVLRN